MKIIRERSILQENVQGATENMRVFAQVGADAIGTNSLMFDYG